ncbi:glycosyltransferase family 4 protein [Sabulilitoribacter multivorans]|uniref:Glycosyltransferase family 4 protein n=1 Tax=Flaviramulus multivorans TaxID=1304750 RepID=A0ABS9IJ17_9FLAO|nr:glycosyltransferase family 4 protein [Flaviramulus multivorans]MCF7560317.1 glycosyltransferase family 4 protein [Flaviramulus multivorans]
MKILLVSMPSLHFFRWTEQLENSGHDVYWFDIVDGNTTSRLPWVKKINGWRLKYPNFKGRYFIKNRLPFLYKLFKPLVERKVETEFEKVLLQVQPDIVHSFVLYISCTPIFPVMLKYKKQKWVYSSWGSDLYFFQNQTTYLNDIKRVLPRVDFLFTDCQRDIKLAKQYGFGGDVLGVFPGGGGFNYNDTNKFIRPVFERKLILVKGYQGRSGRAIAVLKALQKISSNLKPYKIVVFGADDEVELFINKNSIGIELDIECLSRQNFLPHKRILEFMGSALIYIGNSNSDGMPNTLLEAIAQGTFPIQSNPGGATEEVITHGENGLIIQDCNDSQEIILHIKTALNNSDLIERAFRFNQNKIKPKYERGLVQSQVLQAYNTTIK